MGEGGQVKSHDISSREGGGSKIVNIAHVIYGCPIRVCQTPTPYSLFCCLNFVAHQKPLTDRARFCLALVAKLTTVQKEIEACLPRHARTARTGLLNVVWRFSIVFLYDTNLVLLLLATSWLPKTSLLFCTMSKPLGRLIRNRYSWSSLKESIM